MQKTNIYGNEKAFKKELDRIQKAPISKKNKQFITEFLDSMLASNIGEPRAVKLGTELRLLAMWLKKDFDEAVKKDIEKLVKYINIDTNYSPDTKKDYRRMIKQFYKWLKDYDEGYPPEVKWIKSGYGKKDEKKPEDLLTPKEIKKLISNCTRPRDKAFISLLYESGGRIGEVLSMKISDYWMEQYCAKVRLKGKTGTRIIPIVNSIPYITEYLAQHPHTGNKTKPFWVSVGVHSFKQLKYQGCKKILKKLFEKAGIKKRSNPHTFRHSRASELAKRLKEAQMCQYFGWVIGSDQVRTYVHLSGRDLDNEILAYNGIKTQEQEEINPLKIQICPRCKKENGATAQYCNRCSMALSYDSAMESEKRLQEETDKAIQFITEMTNKPELLLEFQEFKLQKRKEEIEKNTIKIESTKLNLT